MARILSLRIVSLLGAAVFVAFFGLTFSVPEWVETFAKAFLEREVSKQVDQTIDRIGPPPGTGALSRAAGALYQKKQAEIEQLKSALREKVHVQLADALADISDLDCECRARLETLLESGLDSRIRLLQATSEKLVEFVHFKYMRVVADLKRDIRIFTGANAAVFLMLLVVSFSKPRAVIHLFLPAALLVVATLVCSYFYLFEQNWLLTIIYSDYLGFAYLGYLGAVFLFLCDIAFNRARVTTELINALLNAIGSVASVAPC